MFRRSLLAMLVSALALGAIVSGAGATGTPVKQAIVMQLKKIQANPEFKSLKTFKVNNAAEAQKAIPKIEALKTVYKNAAAAVAASSATTTAQRTARSDWTSAVKTNISGLGYLITGLNDYVKGDKSAAVLAIDKGVKLDVTANEKSLKAYKLLGIPVS